MWNSKKLQLDDDVFECHPHPTDNDYEKYKSFVENED